jgi:hypothetical protein
MRRSLLIFVLFSASFLSVKSQKIGQGMRRNIALRVPDGANDSLSKSYLNVGIFGNINNLSGFQFGVLTSTVHDRTSGYNLAGLVSLATHRMNGLQMAGIANGVGADMNGIQLCALANITRMAINGVQISGMVNVAAGDARGVQMSGITNLAGNLHGVQVSGFNNIAVERFYGVQFCGIANMAVSITKGVQIAGVMNICASKTRGWQLAAYNYADTLDGSQFGIINACVHHQHGVQIGLINYSRDTVAHKVGLVNVNPNTRIQMMVYGGTSTKINVAARFRNRSTYNIIGFGTHYMGLDKHFSGALFYRIGQYFNIDRHWSISGDLGYYHIETFAENSSASPERLYSLQGRVNADYQMSRHSGIFASLGYGNTRYYDHARLYKSKLLMELGFTLF